MTKVITYGTFDLFHQGHYNILKGARALGDYLIVGVTAESYDLGRGKLNVRDNLVQRIESVKQTGFADEIIVEEYNGQKIRDIQKYNVDILVVGSDWIGKFDYLNRYCKVIYLDRTKNISSTKLRESGSIHKLGMVVDTMDDDSVILESRYVSGLHVDGVFSEDTELAKDFESKYQLNHSTSDYGRLLEENEIVCMILKHTEERKYIEYLTKAIMCKKHIICSLAYLSDAGEVEEILRLANENGVYLFQDIQLSYLQLFDQLVWLIKGGVIGDTISINAALDMADFGNCSREQVYYLLAFVVNRLQGSEIQNIMYHSDPDGFHESIYLLVSNIEFNAQISRSIKGKSEMEIIGSEGRIYIPDNWWLLQYFQIEDYKTGKISRYSLNIDGSGFRYALVSLSRTIDKLQNASQGVTFEESIQINHLANLIGKQGLQ